ncbi:arginine utilization protein RocB [Bacilli bacterium PM5-3]|nr:arginine utilization protein RocB [Bacilli bacterium PM5-3]MDH6603567.1 arginine utilization protein RocB [Bacilli bacterium PM5-9]
MKWQTKDELLQLMKDLVSIKSVSQTPDEINAANFVYESLSTLDYYKKNPEHLIKVDVPGAFPRAAIVALMKKGPSKKTLLGVAHFDTVGVDDAGILKDIITNPDEYTKQVGKLNLDPESRKDLESGEYLFGRGTMDMKAGMALLMQKLEKYSNDDNFDGNLLFSFVGDEEVNSDGALAAIPEVAKVLEREGLEAIACLDTEPDFAAYPNDDNLYMYTGTVGKLLGGFFVLGKETHVGESLSGLNAHLVMANIIRRMEISMDFTEKVGNNVTMPPTSLKLEDHKELYNVQTPLSAHIYYNIQTFKNSPKVYMDKLKKVAQEAIDESYQHVLKMTEEYKQASGLPITPLDMNPQVYTYDEFYQEVKQEYPNIDELIDAQIKELLKDDIDERDLTVGLIKYLQVISSNKNPKVITYFAPSYYPHVSLDASKPTHKAVIDASLKAIDFAKKEFDVDIKQSNYFQGICDLSFFALEDAADVLTYLKPNMPTLGRTYNLPLDEIAKVDVPVINYGPHGRDAHKYTERILVDYSFGVVPVVLDELIKNLFSM